MTAIWLALWSILMALAGALALALAVIRFAPTLMREIADDVMAGALKGWRR